MPTLDERGANRGAKTIVSPRRCSSLASPNSLKTQRPALACAGRGELRIESSTTELRWRNDFQVNNQVIGPVLQPAALMPAPGGLLGSEGRYRRQEPTRLSDRRDFA